jgi:hypothetical protein
VPVELQRPGELDEWEASWYRERLHDQSLVDDSVVVVIDGTRYLAVPVGGQRRGGYIPVDDRDHLWQLRDALKDRTGFPFVRLRWSDRPDVCHSIAWGDLMPRSADSDEQSQFYGFDPAAVARADDEELGCVR